ncbi:hypothetical protein, partial [Cohnella laeviribosi]|uniref:hypothetical protein n=1 Tax=Cohnella laeviribosi TaxID=380174 RepID=UPI00146BB1BA
VLPELSLNKYVIKPISRQTIHCKIKWSRSKTVHKKQPPQQPALQAFSLDEHVELRDIAFGNRIVDINNRMIHPVCQ